MTHKLDELADTISLSYAAEFVPLSKSRNRPKTGEPRSLRDLSLNWRVTLSKGERSLTTDYMQGIGHIPGYRHDERLTVDYWDPLKFICERGKVPRYFGAKNFVSSPISLNLSARDLTAPKLADILYCLVSDAEVLDYPTFEEWAGSFGFNTDSREGERAYRACLEIGLKLRAMLGDETLSKLREAAQDY